MVRKCPKLLGFQEEEGLLLTNDEMMVANSSSLLRILMISECDALKFIPDVRGFTSLQQLDIQNCGELETYRRDCFKDFAFSSSKTLIPLLLISEDDDDDDDNDGDDDDAVGVGSNNPLLPSLRDLWIWDWNTLQSLPECLGNLASLEKLKILSCKNLRHLLSKEQMQRLTFLKQLDISLCHAISSIDVGSFASLRQLEVTRCSGVKASEGLSFLTALEKLVLGPFSEDLDCFPLLLLGADSDDNSGEVKLITPLLPSLRELEIKGWPAIQSLPRDLQHLTMLTSLSIRHFNGLKELPEWLGNLASLVTLKISDCEDLTYLPSKEQMHRLTLLKELSISECGRLHYNCFTYGPEWPKISHIPYVVII